MKSEFGLEIPVGKISEKLYPTITENRQIEIISARNSGVVRICRILFDYGREKYPDTVNNFSYLFVLDALGIYGADIGKIYYDVCKENLETLANVLAAWQMTLITRERIHTAIQNRSFDDDLADAIKRLKERTVSDEQWTEMCRKPRF